MPHVSNITSCCCTISMPAQAIRINFLYVCSELHELLQVCFKWMLINLLKASPSATNGRCAILNIILLCFCNSCKGISLPIYNGMFISSLASHQLESIPMEINSITIGGEGTQDYGIMWNARTSTKFIKFTWIFIPYNERITNFIFYYGIYISRSIIQPHNIMR